jgi:hypothetical protein
MEDKLVDALYNTWLDLERYKKLQDVPMNQDVLAAFRTKVNSFCDITENWSKKSQKSDAHWQPTTLACEPSDASLRASSGNL